MKKLALSLGFRLASRGSYPKKPRQDLCMACTIGRRKGRRGTTKDVIQEHVACPVVVTGKLQLDEDGKVKEGARFEITQLNIAHNHPLGLGGDDDDDDDEEKPDAKSAPAGKGKKGTKRKRADVDSVANGTDGEDDNSSVIGDPPGPPVPLRLPKSAYRSLGRSWLRADIPCSRRSFPDLGRFPSLLAPRCRLAWLPTWDGPIQGILRHSRPAVLQVS